MSILALDPGLTKPGVAFLQDDLLVKAERLRVDAAWSKLGILERSDHVAELACEWFEQFESRITAPVILIVEWPQWYGDNEKGIDQNDLAGLCAIAGGTLRGLRSQWVIDEARSPKPRQVWGSVPKATTGNPWRSPRGRRLFVRLSPTEREVVAPYHDALDAAGLALFAAGRWKQRRVEAGAI